MICDKKTCNIFFSSKINCNVNRQVYKFKYPNISQIMMLYSNSNSTFIALNLYLMIDSKTQKAKIRDRNR